MKTMLRLAACLFLVCLATGLHAASPSGSIDNVAAPASQPWVVTSGGPYEVTEGTEIILSGSATHPRGDRLTYAWDFDDDGVFEVSGQNVAFMGVDGPSTWTVALRVDDGETAVTTKTTVTVHNATPAVGPVHGLANPVDVNTFVDLSASFTDAGILDWHTSSFWSWGDGTTTPGTVEEAYGSGTLRNSHTYSAPGQYTVTLTVTDDDASSQEITFPVTVVEKPPELTASPAS